MKKKRIAGLVMLAVAAGMIWSGLTFWLFHTNMICTKPEAPADAGIIGMSGSLLAALFAAAGIIVGLAALLLALEHSRLKHRENELLARDELFSGLSRNVDEVFLMLDAASFRVDYVSPNTERLLGLPERLVREDVHAIEHIAKGNETGLVLDQLASLRPGEPKQWDRRYIHQKTGEVRWFHVVAFCGDLRGKKKFMLELSDHTRDKQINMALEEAVRSARSADRAKSAFLSMLSHDIRTPLNAVIGFATLAKGHLDNRDRISGYLDKILASGSLQLSLINEVLDMSRIESGKIQLNETEVSLLQIIREVENVVSGQLQAKRLSLRLDVGGIRNDTVLCDRTRLIQVLMNLMSNAIKFTPEGGEVFLSAAQLPDAPQGKGLYELRVRDTGIGMSPEFVEKVFEPFERERTPAVSEIQGTGLGMSITKRIIDMMGGTIQVRSGIGEGTEFAIRIAWRLGTESGGATLPAERRLAAARELPSFRGKRLLLVEDNELNREIAQETLSGYGFELETAENGAAAVERVAASEPGAIDLILMDIRMPVMDGCQATRAIRALENRALSQIPILAMTANAFEEDREAAIESGMDGFLSKPVRTEEVVEALGRILDQA